MAKRPRVSPSDDPPSSAAVDDEEVSRFDTSSGRMRYPEKNEPGHKQSEFAHPQHKVVEPPVGSVDAIPDPDARAIAKSVMLQQMIRQGDQANPQGGFSYLDNIANILLNPAANVQGSNAEQNMGVLLDQLTGVDPNAYLGRPNYPPMGIPLDDLRAPLASSPPYSSDIPGEAGFSKRKLFDIPRTRPGDYIVRHSGDNDGK